MPIPPCPADEAELEERLSRPTPGVLQALSRTPGDILVLGAAGKMGPTLCRMAARALAELGRSDRVIAVSRFTDRALPARLAEAGVVPAEADLLDRTALARLPHAPNIIFMAGQKFGTQAASGAGCWDTASGGSCARSRSWWR